MSDENAAAAALLQTGVIVPIRIVEEVVTQGPDEGEFGLRLAFSFDDEECDEEDRAEVVEWGAFGFLFVIGALSFHDARPRGASEMDYQEDDEFRVGDFLTGLQFRGGELRFDADYVRGRRMKTWVRVRQDGTGVIETVGRGKSAMHWIARLKGGKPLRAVDR